MDKSIAGKMIKKEALNSISIILDFLENTESVLFSIRDDRKQINYFIDKGIELMSLVNYEKTVNEKVMTALVVYVISVQDLMRKKVKQVSDPDFLISKFLKIFKDQKKEELKLNIN